MEQGGNAFPGMEYDATAGQRYHYGMTLRDYFAGQALIAEANRNNKTTKHLKITVERCYQYADAMIKERNSSQINPKECTCTKQ